MKRINKSSNKIFGGVLGGIGEYMEIDPVWLRLGYLVFGFINFGAAVLLYIIALIIMPKDEEIVDANVINVETNDFSSESEVADQEHIYKEAEYNDQEAIKNGGDATLKTESKSVNKNNNGSRNPLLLIGLGLIVVGLALLFEQIYNIEIWSAIVFYYNMLKVYIFPVLLIFLGLFIIFKRRS